LAQRIPFIDELHLGSQDNLPSDVLNNNKAVMFITFAVLLGIIGLLYHAEKI
jgi:hypothetical protein